MAILITNDGDRIVGTIAERNAITRRFDGMVVTVQDSIADVYTGGGAANYTWNATRNKWFLTWKENSDDLVFTSEELIIAEQGLVTLSKTPQSNMAWDCFVTDLDNMLLVDLSNPFISGTSLSIGSSDYTGMKLFCTYAYGRTQATVAAIGDLVTSVAGRIGSVSLDKNDVGLGNVDNTTDLLKPVSTATQTALNLKANQSTTYTKTEVNNAISSATPSFTTLTGKPTTLSGYGITDAQPTISIGQVTQYYRGDKTWSILDKSTVGLSNVNNTTDLLKPISTATQTALDLKVDEVAGKQLSTEDYTTTEKTKLGTIETNAQVNTVNSVAGRQGVVSLTKTDVGLNNVENIALSTWTGSTNIITVGDVSATSLTISGNILPNVTQSLNIGSPALRFKAIYVDEAHLAVNTLYIGDTAILGTSSQTINIHGDLNQSLDIQTSGTGTTTIESAKAVTVTTTGINADVFMNAIGSGSNIRIGATNELQVSASAAVFACPVTSNSHNIIGNLTVGGNLVVNGTQSVINSTIVDVRDNIMVLNSGEIGSGVTNGTSGIQVDRGDLADYQLVFDETDDLFKIGAIGSLEIISTRPWTTSNFSGLNHNHNFDALLNVTISNKQTNDYVKWNGTAWVNAILTKSVVGLGDVDNTTDLLKPISTATQTALNLKANLASPTFTGTVSGITKTMVGLGNVDNTTDLLKPISTATQTALDLKANQSSTYTKTEVDTAISSATPSFATLTGKPTTLSGYGITDAQTLDADLTSIAGLIGNSGILKKTATNTWVLDTTAYLSSNQTITVSGDVTGSGGTSIALTLAPVIDSGVGLFKKVSVDTKGRVTGTSLVTQADITGLLGAGSITNTMLVNSAVANLSGTNTGDETLATIKTKLGVTTLSGSNTGDQTTITGNAGSATVLQTTRTINGVSFDGSSNITVNAVDSTARIASSLIGAANGVCPLDSTSKILSTYLPSYVDDVVEYNTFSAFPSIGETGKIYVDVSTNKVYRWSGTVYVYITSGAVDSVAGRTGVVTLTKNDVGLGNVDNTTDLLKPVSTATQTALNLKANLASPTFTGTVSGITKAMVGLSNVDNTTDLLKPVSTATQTAFDLKVDKVTGKQLSTEDYTTAEKTKLAGLSKLSYGEMLSYQLITTTTTANQVAATFSASVYGSAKILVQVSSGTSYQVTELLLIHDGITASIMEYGNNFTNTDLIVFDCDVSAGNVRLLVTPSNASSTIKSIFTLINK